MFARVFDLSTGKKIHSFFSAGNTADAKCPDLSQFWGIVERQFRFGSLGRPIPDLLQIDCNRNRPRASRIDMVGLNKRIDARISVSVKPSLTLKAWHLDLPVRTLGTQMDLVMLNQVDEYYDIGHRQDAIWRCG